MKQTEFNFTAQAEGKPYWETDLFKELQPSIVRAFRAFHAQNPQVYLVFKKFAEEVRSAGRRRFGVRAIGERMRWYTMIETRGDDFKINNNHQACYGRLLMLEDPFYRQVFSRRVSRDSKEFY